MAIIQDDVPIRLGSLLVWLVRATLISQMKNWVVCAHQQDLFSVIVFAQNCLGITWFLADEGKG